MGMTTGRRHRSNRFPTWIAKPALFLRTWLSPHQRAVRKVVRERPGELFQPVAETRMHRHPALFAFVATELAMRTQPSVLSYGCSTGDEAFTLAEYLPCARIDAIDINPRSVRRATRRASRRSESTIRFACAGTPPSIGVGYDAIFCLSVLRHARLDAERPPTCSAILPFERFADMIGAFDRVLRPDGLLVLWGTNFRFADTPAAERYRVLAVPGQRAERGAFYGSDNRLLDDDLNRQFVFRKLVETPID
jgi:SAM-dependent methyltransferase